MPVYIKKFKDTYNKGTGDLPEYAQFLVGQHIDSISFNADALLKGIENIGKAEDAPGIPTMEDLSEKYIS